MRFKPVTPPRTFEVGLKEKIILKDCARIELDNDEQVTFLSASGAEYDVAKKSWGYYATPSLNARLSSFHLKAALVSGIQKRYYIMLVESSYEKEFINYLSVQQMKLVTWLDQEKSLNQISSLFRERPIDCLCGSLADGSPADGSLADGSQSLKLVHTYNAPPTGEMQFQLSKPYEPKRYKRQLFRCETCGHFLSKHEMDISSFYEGEYVSSTYGDEQGLLKTFQKIISLDPSKSDNFGRTNRIHEFAKNYFGKAKNGAVLDGGNNNQSILDVGAGLGVFVYRMKQLGWDCTALDPDARAVAHIEKNTGVRALCADFMEVQDNSLHGFDVVSFNKVLEHVVDPVAMLLRARKFLKPNGFVYLELPDGEVAVKDGFGREEFFIEHHHVFSFASFNILAQKAGFTVIAQERLQEPSTKYTIRGFLKCET